MTNAGLDPSRRREGRSTDQVAELRRRIRELERLARENEHREKFAERFELAQWATESAIWDWNLVTGEFWSSPGHQILFGRGENEITEYSDLEDADNPWASHLHPEDRARVLQCIHDHFENDATYDVDYRYRLPDG